MLRSAMTDSGDLAVVAAQLEKATSPVMIFGELSGTADEQLAQARKVYRHLALLAHPDTANGDAALAELAFERLTVLWERAQRQISAGVYGTSGGEAIGLRVTGKRHRYVLDGLLSAGDVADVYTATVDDDRSVIFKLARKPTSAEVMRNEASVLRTLGKEVDDDYAAYFPNLVESLRVRGKGGTQRVANILEMPGDLWSLEEVVATYADLGRTIQPKDMAWVWRRLLTALGAAHQAGIVHGAVLPSHVLIEAEQHGVVLAGWGAAVPAGQPLRWISKAYRQWYPTEVFFADPVTAETDIAMAARTMIYLLGGTPAAGVCPSSCPPPLRAFFRACTLTKQNMRPDDAWALKATFDDLIERLWGPRRFRPFYMPKR